jgi:Ca2+-transporting ATPase
MFEPFIAPGEVRVQLLLLRVNIDRKPLEFGLPQRNSTECAMVLFVESMGFKYEQIRRDNPTLAQYDFNSDRKRMTTVITDPTTKEPLIVCQGAPEIVLERCTKYVTAAGKENPIDAAFTQALTAQLLEYSHQCLRGLLVAYRVGGGYGTEEVAEKEMTVIGIVGISDPVRDEVPGAIKDCRRAGVIVRMCTGDNIETAKAIAIECGIYDPGTDQIAMTGNEFRATAKLALLEKLPHLAVLARSTPMDKFRLVRLLRECGEVVAVTGDGSNDAPALKAADVGLSMGLCGTEIAKEASDICILDDNFKSIMMALMWGRCVFDNVRRFLQFQLVVNVVAVIITFLGSCIFKESPFKAIQLLWVNLVMDSFGALALATEKPAPYLLDRPPFGRKVPLLGGLLRANIVGQALYQLVILILILTIGDKIWTFEDPDDPTDEALKDLHLYTLIFTAFVFMQIFNLFNSRVVATSQSFFSGLFQNWLFDVILVMIIIVQIILTEFGGPVFHTMGLNGWDWLGVGVVSVGTIIMGFIIRLCPVGDVTPEQVEAERVKSYEAVKEKLRGMSDEEQWALEHEQEAAEKKRVDEQKGKAKSQEAFKKEAEEVAKEPHLPWMI